MCSPGLWGQNFRRVVERAGAFSVAVTQRLHTRLHTLPDMFCVGSVASARSREPFVFCCLCDLYVPQQGHEPVAAPCSASLSHFIVTAQSLQINLPESLGLFYATSVTGDDDTSAAVATATAASEAVASSAVVVGTAVATGATSASTGAGAAVAAPSAATFP